MTVSTPQRPPPAAPRDAPDDLEALIEEARRRARRRRLRNAAAVTLALGAAALGAVGLWLLGNGGSATNQVAAAPLPIPPPVHRGPLPRNGDIALVQDGTLVAKSADGSHTRFLAACPRTYGDCFFGGFAWSPNGFYLAFFAGHLGGGLTVNNLGLYIVSTQRWGAQELALCGDCDRREIPAWSPDSRRVAFTSGSGADIVIDVTGKSRAIADKAGAAGFRHDSTGPAWSPGGTRIAFGDGSNLYVEKPNGAGVSRIATAGPQVADLSWSPDGTKIAFDSGDAIFVVDADGSHLKPVVVGGIGSGPGVPSWSPDGSRILYFSTPGSPTRYKGQVWSMRPDGSDRRLLYDEGCCVGDWNPPIWSPDGRWVAVSGATETDGVVVMDARGEHRRRLLESPSAVAWQPLPPLVR